MKKLIILLTVIISFTFCKGPGSGPLVRESFDKKDPHDPGGSEKHMARVITVKADVKVEPCADCITIGKVLADKQSYSGKVIRVRGQITKYNAGIMGKNWIHIQDGTEYRESFDLTITTDATSSVGEIVTFEGTIAIDKDFGFGYAYNVIMEEAKPVN